MKLSLMSNWRLFSTRLIVIILFVEYMHLWLTTLSLSLLIDSIMNCFLLIRSSPERQQQKCSWKKSSTTLINQENLKKSEKGVIILPTQTMHYHFREIPWKLPCICCPIKMTPCKNAGFFGGLPNPYPNPSNFQPNPSLNYPTSVRRLCWGGASGT